MASIDEAAGIASDLVGAMSGGQRESGSKPAESLERVKVFQSNFLSLISHELRTPLSSIRNALVMLDESSAESPDPITRELLDIALRNARRLDHQLSSLLDLAELEASAFHARLKEVDLARVGKGKAEGYGWDVKAEAHASNSDRVLADPKKVHRMFELIKDLIEQWGDERAKCSVRFKTHSMGVSFALREGQEAAWAQNWTQAEVAIQSGVHKQSSYFEGALQSEKDFLSRDREGLGSELLILQEIIRRHEAQFEMEQDGVKVTLTIAFPKLEDPEAFQKVLSSRLSSLTGELGSVALVLVRPEKADLEGAFQKLGEALYRSSDSVYKLANGLIALLLDDVKIEDIQNLSERMRSKTGPKGKMAVVHAPSDGEDPVALMELALRRLG